MADKEETSPSAPPKSRREDNDEKDTTSKSRSPKKKVRRHRVHKQVDSLDKVEEETDEEEAERRRLRSRERIKLSMEGIDLDDVPTLSSVIEEKPPVVMVEDPEEEPPEVQVEPPVEEEEEEEFDDEPPCMTEEEKEAMYNAASLGDIDLLEDCLDKPNSDINMVWFQENLLIAALKTQQEEMAEFLIDNGVDYNFTTTVIRVKEERTRDIEWETFTCRQMAYDKGLSNITDLIDFLNGELFPFIKLKQRIPRYRRPKPPTPEPSTGGESENDAGSEASKDRSDDEGDAKAKKKKRKKKKESREEDVEKMKEGTDEKERNERKVKIEKSKEHLEINDEDSGHHSSESFADTEKDEEVRKTESAGSKQMRSRASSSKTRTGSSQTRTGSSRCSTRLTTTTRSPSPPPPKSETFLKRFCFINCPSDEGYGSLASSQRSPRMSETKLRRQKVPITIPPRGTKSSLGMRQASLHRKADAEQDEERPLTQKKITIPGSYAAESSRWYRKSNMDRVTKSKNDMPNMTQCSVPKPQHAHYMQMTTSAYTKRRLEPNFRKAYSSLDFVSDRLTRSPQVSGNRKILHQRPSINPRTYSNRGRENISLDLKSYNPSMLRPHSLPTSVNNQLFRTVIRVY